VIGKSCLYQIISDPAASDREYETSDMNRKSLYLDTKKLCSSPHVELSRAKSQELHRRVFKSRGQDALAYRIVTQWHPLHRYEIALPALHRDDR